MRKISKNRLYHSKIIPIKIQLVEILTTFVVIYPNFAVNFRYYEHLNCCSE